MPAALEPEGHGVGKTLAGRRGNKKGGAMPIWLHRGLVWAAGMSGLFAGFLTALWPGVATESGLFWVVSFVIGPPLGLGLSLLVSKVPVRCPQCGGRAFFDRQERAYLVIRCLPWGEVSVQRWT